MSRLEPILVAYDGSAPAKAAAACARAIAAREGLRTILLHVNEPGDRFWDLTLEQQPARAAAARRLLEEEASRFQTPVEVVDVEGEAVHTLELEAVRRKAGMVAIGTHGRSALGRAVFGSVALGVLQVVQRPVLVAHEPFESIRHVVVGVEDAPAAWWVVTEARAVADATGAALTMAHVLTADREFAAHGASLGLPAGVWEEAMKATAERIFGPHRAAAGPDVRERLLFGWAPGQLRDLAAPLRAEVVVVGRRGKSKSDLGHIWSVAVTLAMRGPFATLIV